MTFKLYCEQHGKIYIFRQLTILFYDSFPITREFEKDLNKVELLLQKGIYPYKYMDNFDRFKETQLPRKQSFYSSLNDENITDEEYQHAQDVYREFNCKHLCDYHDLYVRTDVLLLADVFVGRGSWGSIFFLEQPLSLFYF